MIRITNIKIAAHKEQQKVLEQELCRLLHIKSLQNLQYHIVKKSIDARKKESIQCIYTVDVSGVKDEAKIVAKCKNNNITIAHKESYTEPVHGDKLFYIALLSSGQALQDYLRHCCWLNMVIGRFLWNAGRM